jgi:hypothetical protein
MPRGLALCLHLAGGVFLPEQNARDSAGHGDRYPKGRDAEGGSVSEAVEPVSGEAGCPLISGDPINQFLGVMAFRTRLKDGRFERLDLSHWPRG